MKTMNKLVIYVLIMFLMVNTVSAEPIATTITVYPISGTSNICQGVGFSVSLYADIKDQNGNVMLLVTPVWTSSNTAIATVRLYGISTGIVSCKSPGTASITASYGEISATSIITVPVILVATTIDVTPSIVTTNIGFSEQLTATIKDQNGGIMSVTPSWSSSNIAIATVNPIGMVTGRGVGTSIITASYGSLSKTSIFTVTAPGVVIVSPSMSVNTFISSIWEFLKSIFVSLPAHM